MNGRRGERSAARRSAGVTVVALASVLLARAPCARATEPAVRASSPTAARSAPAATTSGRAPPASTADDWQRWRGLSFGSYLSPKTDFVTDDGGIDVVFHFHAGQTAERQMKESGMSAVFVSCGYGTGSGAYADALSNPQRFGRMVTELVKSVEVQTGKQGVHLRHLALASWSAGFAAVGKILAVDRYYAMVDTVILNDSLHSQYKTPKRRTAAQGADRVDLTMMRPFVRFAKDAAAGRKTMAITHSAVVPPDYASSTEATEALLTAIEVPTTKPSADDASAASRPSMRLVKRADAGNLHVRGFGGRGPRDHFEHLYLLGEALRTWVVPRWKREDRLVYTRMGE